MALPPHLGESRGDAVASRSDTTASAPTTPVRTVDLARPADPHDSGSRAAPLADARPVARPAVEAEARATLEAELAALRERAERLQSLAASLAAAREPDEVLRVAADAGRLAARADGAVVMALAEDAPRTLAVVCTSGFPEALLGRWARYPLAARTPVAESVRDARPVWLATPEAIVGGYPSLAEFVAATGCRAMVALPFVTPAGRAHGALALGFAAPRTFDADERAFLTAFSRQCAQALERARLAREEQEQAGRVARLQAVTAALSGAVTPEEVAVATVREGMLAVGADGGTLALLARDGHALRLVHTSAPPALRVDGADLPVELALPMAEVVHDGEPLFVESPADLHPHHEETALALGVRGVQAVAALPLVLGGAGAPTLGAMELVFRQPTRFDPDDRALMMAIARQCAQALERARLFAAQARTARRAQRLQEVTAALSRAVTPQAVANVVVTAGVESLGAEAGVVVRLSSDAQTIAVLAAAGYDDASVRAWETLSPLASRPLVDLMREQRPLFVGSRAERGTVFGPFDAGFEAAAFLPLEAEGRPIGVFVLSFAQCRTWDDDDRLHLTTLAQQCAQALERARLYAEADAARAQAEEANRAKSDFLAKMSHELRTPLNAVGGYAELIELGIHGPVTDEQKVALDRIRKSQRALLARIDELLAFARVETGRIEFEFEDVPLAEVLRDVEALLAPQAAAREIRLRVGVAEGVGDQRALSAWADRDKLMQVLINLGTNAVKYTSAGGSVSFACDEWRDFAGRGWVRVSVQDTGIGIPSDKLEAIFDPFVQVKKGRNDPTEGIGLGLAIARQLCGAMNGRLAVESAVGAGSTFTATLPRGRSR